MDLSLDRVREVLNFLNNPQDEIKVIHVAGTNGKGSICSLLESILTKSILKNCSSLEKNSEQANRNFLKVGKFNSPHLLQVEDSLKINRENITKEKLIEIKSYVTGVATNLGIELTNFELLTVSMYFWFYESKVDIAIVEVGLGGTLDATNVLKNPLICVFSSISIDHENFLGSTIKDIATHKAGILKKKCSTVISHQKEPEATTVIRDACNLLESQVVESGLAELCEETLDFFSGRLVKYISKTSENSYQVKLRLEGGFQLANLACALDTIDLLKIKCFDTFEIPLDSVTSGVNNASWPGRLQWLDYPKYGPCLVDGAHNPAAALELISYVKKYLLKFAEGPSFCIHWVYASTQGKNHKEILNIFFNEQQTDLAQLLPNLSIKNSFHLVEFSQPDEMPWIKPTDVNLIYEFLNSSNRPNVFTKECINLETAFGDILEYQKKNSEEKQLIIVTGSLYLVADLFRFLEYSY